MGNPRQDPLHRVTRLPVLFDGGSRYYLVSNQIRKGEENLSPIKKALPDEMPKEAKPLQVNFDDKDRVGGLVG